GVAQGGDVAALAGGDPGRLLAAVLQRVEREVGEPGDVVARRVYAEHPAFITRAVAVGREPLESGQGARFPRKVVTCVTRRRKRTTDAYQRRVAVARPRFVYAISA